MTHADHIPTDLARRLDEAELLRAHQQWHELLELVETAVGEAPPSGVLAGQAWQLKAVALEHLGQLDEARSAIATALQADEMNGRSHAVSADLFRLAGDLAAALEEGKRAVEVAPGNASYWITYGHYLRDAGRASEALAAYERATELNSHDSYAWLGYGNALYDLGRYQEAMERYRHALSLASPGTVLHTATVSALATALIKAKDYPAAREAAELALALTPEAPQALHLHADANYYLGRYTDALTDLNRALEFTPEDADLWAKKGSTLVRLHRYAEAVEAYDHSLTLKPDQPEVVQARAQWWAYRYLEQGEYTTDAMRQASEGIASSIWVTVGWMLLRERRYDEALRASDLGHAAAPNASEPLVLRARISLNQFRMVAFVRAFREALRLALRAAR